MKNALDCFWPLLEFVEPVMAIWSQWAWPSGVWEQLIEADFLCRTVNAETVLCPGCYQHDEEVIALDRPGGGVDLFVPCPESLRAQVDPEWLHQWTGNYVPRDPVVIPPASASTFPPDSDPSLLESLGDVLASRSMPSVLLIVLIGVQIWRAFRRAAKQPLLLDDDSFERLRQLIVSLMAPSDTVASGPTAPPTQRAHDRRLS